MGTALDFLSSAPLSTFGLSSSTESCCRGSESPSPKATPLQTWMGSPPPPLEVLGLTTPQHVHPLFLLMVEDVGRLPLSGNRIHSGCKAAAGFFSSPPQLCLCLPKELNLERVNHEGATGLCLHPSPHTQSHTSRSESELWVACLCGSVVCVCWRGETTTRVPDCRRDPRAQWGRGQKSQGQDRCERKKGTEKEGSLGRKGVQRGRRWRGRGLGSDKGTAPQRLRVWSWGRRACLAGLSVGEEGVGLV